MSGIQLSSVLISTRGVRLVSSINQHTGARTEYRSYRWLGGVMWVAAAGATVGLIAGGVAWALMS